MTEKLYDVTALGEILIDFTEWGFSDDGARLFAQNPGGAVANVAAAVARLGGRAAFVGKVGADMHGTFLRQTLQEAGVDVSGVATDAERFTTLAFVKLAENGERSFSFARYDAADTNLRWEEVPRTLLTDTRVLSVGTLGMTDEPMRTTQLRCIETAKAAGAYIAVDPNYRATLWRSEGDFLRQTERLLELADYVKLSDEETALVTGCTDPEKALEALERRGVRTAVVTRDKGGAMALSGGQLVRAAGVPAVAVAPPVRATPSGAVSCTDCCIGAILWKHRRRGCWRTVWPSATGWVRTAWDTWARSVECPPWHSWRQCNKRKSSRPEPGAFAFAKKTSTH